jgi:hypothetical protein
MVTSKAGDLFAVQISADAWGFCRAWRGIGIEIPPIFTRTPGMPEYSNWAPVEPPKWLFELNLCVQNLEPPTIVAVGKVPFALEEDAVMPPTWREPDAVEPRYTIEERGIYRYTSDPADLKGIAKQITLTPATLGAFLRQQYEGGALREVDVREANGMNDPNTDLPNATGVPDEVEPPMMVFAKIVQAIGPAEREVEYEEPMAAFLAEHDLGEVTGGGTMQDRDGSVLFAGLDIEVRDVERAVPLIARRLAELGAPEGSVLEYDADGEPVSYPIRKI